MNCARCGFPTSEHHYNGACYGVCGEFTLEREVKMPEVEVDRLTKDRDQVKRLAEAAVEQNNKYAAEIERLTSALEDIALLDECDGHELEARHAFKAVAIATKTLGKHPSEIAAARPMPRADKA